MANDDGLALFLLLLVVTLAACAWSIGYIVGRDGARGVANLHQRLTWMEANISELWSRQAERDEADAAAETMAPPSDDYGDDNAGMRAHREMYGDAEDE